MLEGERLELEKRETAIGGREADAENKERELDEIKFKLEEDRIEVESTKKEYKREVALMSALRSQNIVSILGCVTRPQELVILMEFCEGGTLRNLLDLPREEPPFGPQKQIKMALDVAYGMTYVAIRSAAEEPPPSRLLRSSRSDRCVGCRRRDRRLPPSPALFAAMCLVSASHGPISFCRTSPSERLSCALRCSFSRCVAWFSHICISSQPCLLCHL